MNYLLDSLEKKLSRIHPSIIFSRFSLQTLAAFMALDLSLAALIFIILKSIDLLSLSSNYPWLDNFAFKLAWLDGTLTGALEGVLKANAVFLFLQPIARMSKMSAIVWLVTAGYALYVNFARADSAAMVIMNMGSIASLSDTSRTGVARQWGMIGPR
jgi:hypothetical protein